MSEKVTKPTAGDWINAMRLRTLPLSLASVLTGSFLALQQGSFELMVFVFGILTTVFLQINSNLANDYGDFSHGTDNENRIGPERTMQAGKILPSQMKRAIWIFSGLSLLAGISLLYFAQINFQLKLIFLAMGLLAIYASITYTAGEKPYGYRGLGDLSVILFFGFLSVAGTYLLHGPTFTWHILLPAFTIGCFSAGVLNLNNTRDMVSDRESGKITVAVRLGPKLARVYQLVLILAGWLSMIAYAGLRFELGWSWTYLASMPLFLLIAIKTLLNKNAAELDPMLKQLAISTFLFSLLLGLGIGLA